MTGKKQSPQSLPMKRRHQIFLWHAEAACPHVHVGEEQESGENSRIMCCCSIEGSGRSLWWNSFLPWSLRLMDFNKIQHWLPRIGAFPKISRARSKQSFALTLPASTIAVPRRKSHIGFGEARLSSLDDEQAPLLQKCALLYCYKHGLRQASLTLSDAPPLDQGLCGCSGGRSSAQLAMPPSG